MEPGHSKFTTTRRQNFAFPELDREEGKRGPRSSSGCDHTGKPSTHAHYALLAEDDYAFRWALAIELERNGFDLDVAENASEAIDLLKVSGRHCCLIVDLRLPGLNGFELMERLRLRGSSTPIVFITGDGGPSPNDPTIHAGTPSLAKPFDEHDLIAAITRALSATHERAR
jgi:FixJ family two-component response regulator